MSDVSYQIEMARGLPVVTAPEKIDVTNADRLRVALPESAARGHATFVVDLSRAQFCDSAARPRCGSSRTWYRTLPRPEPRPEPRGPEGLP